MPQPFNKVPVKQRGVMFNFQLMTNHAPKCVSLMAESIGIWPAVETQLLTIFLKILEGSARSVNAIYSELTTFRMRRAILESTAREVLETKEYDLLCAVLTFAARAAKGRDRIAHWEAGFCESIQNAIVLYNPAHRARLVVAEIEYDLAYNAYRRQTAAFFEATLGQQGAQRGTPDAPLAPARPAPSFEGLFVYYERDLLEIRDNLFAARLHLRDFAEVMSAKTSVWPTSLSRHGIPHPYDEGFQRLSAQPEIAEILARPQKPHQNNP